MKAKIGLVVMCGMLSFCFEAATTARVLGSEDTIHWASVTSVWLDCTKKQLPEFEKETGIKVIVDEMHATTLREKTLTDLVTEAGGYDVMNIEEAWVAEYLARFLEPLEPYIEEYKTDVDDFLPSALEHWGKWRGEIYAFPYDINTRYFFYRKDVFEKYGIPVPTSPKEYFSTEEFLHVLEKVNRPQEGYYAVGISGSKTSDCEPEWLGFFYSFGGESILDENYQPLVNTKPGVEGLKYYLEIGKYAPPGHVSWHWDHLLASGQKGTVACSIQPSVFAGALMDPAQSEIAGAGGRNVGWFAYPQKDNLPVIGVYGGWGIGISRFSKNKKNAYRLIHWLSDKRIAAERAKMGAIGASQISVYLNDDVIREHRDYYRFALERLETARGFVPRLPINAEFMDILAREINLAFVTGKRPRDLMDKVAKEMSKVLKSAGYLE